MVTSKIQTQRPLTGAESEFDRLEETPSRPGIVRKEPDSDSKYLLYIVGVLVAAIAAYVIYNYTPAQTSIAPTPTMNQSDTTPTPPVVVDPVPASPPADVPIKPPLADAPPATTTTP